MPEVKSSSDVAALLDRAAQIKQAQKQEPKVEEPVVETGDKPLANISMTGVMVHEDGQLTKVRYLEDLALNKDQYAGIMLTEEEAKSVAMSVKFQSTGLNSAIPLKCAGDACAFKNSCPYFKIGKAPVGLPCILEGQLITYWTEKYIDEFDVNAENLTELHLVSELAEFDIYEMRVTKYLAEKHPTLMQEIVTGITEQGEIVSNEEISRAFDLKERIKRSRMKVLESLMATRKERVKLATNMSEGTGTAQQLSDIKKKLDDFQKAVGKTEYIVDAEYEESV